MQTTERTNRLANIDSYLSEIIQKFSRDTKHIFKENVIAEYLFGAYAKNTQTPTSDIDILIIVKHYTPELQWKMSGLASEYSLQYDICISPILQDVKVWNKNQRYHTLLHQEVTENGIRL